MTLHWYGGAAAVVLTLGLPVVSSPQPAVPDRPVFRGRAQLVVQTVRVTDPQGVPIAGLGAADFVVTENGDPQELAFLEFQRLTKAPAAPATKASAEPAADPPARGELPVLPPSELPRPRYRDHRLVALYFDLSAMDDTEAFRAFTGAGTFISEHMAPPDLVAILTFERGVVRLRQDFTDEQARLLATLQTLLDGDDGAGLSMAFGQNDGEFTLFNTNRQLAALQTAVTMFAGHGQQTTLIYFGSGMALNATRNQAQFRATVNAAVRANVTINPVDTRGLVPLLPLGDASQPSPRGQGLYTGAFATAGFRQFEQSQDTLHALAADTGGRAMVDDNDLAREIAQATQAATSYYVLAYYSTHTERDGRLRRVRITLREDRDARLAYRRAYYGLKDFADFTDADKERQLEEALMVATPLTDLTMAMELQHFQLNSAEYFVSVFLTFPGSEVETARRRGGSRVTLDLIGEVRTRYGAMVQNLRDKVEIRLTEETARHLQTRPIVYETGFTLLPDQYVIKVLARDATTGRLGTYETPFTIPNLEREDRLVPLSSVVLSDEEVGLGNEWHRVDPNPEVDDVHPLVHNGRKMVPNLTRVFSRERDLQVLLEAYQRARETTPGPLVAFVTLHDDDERLFETPPLLAPNGPPHRPWAVPLRFRVRGEALPTGRMQCQVTVLDPEGQKVAFWQAPVVIAPETNRQAVTQ